MVCDDGLLQNNLQGGEMLFEIENLYFKQHFDTEEVIQHQQGEQHKQKYILSGFCINSYE